jgi:uncharacterized protein HemY
MKRFILIIVFFAVRVIVIACPACTSQQPKILRGITHGTGPENNWDYVIVLAAVAVVLFTLLFSVKCLLHPGEKNSGHIKQFIFNEA